MTQTLEAAARAASPQQRVDEWLAAFEKALVDRDVEAATALFAPTCFWRDLVAFSWNLTTVENREEVADLLRSTLEATDPSGFYLALQLKARQAGIPTPVYGLQEVHHLS